MDPVDPDKKEVRRPMNAFLIFCKRHRSMVREKNPNLDNRNVTRILGDLWANLKDDEKMQYTDLAKQYKDAFMKANPDYKWHNPEKGMHPTGLLPRSPTKDSLDFTRADQTITPGKLADPSNMGGLSLLFMAGQQNASKAAATSQTLDLSREKATRFDSGPALLPHGQGVSGIEQCLQSDEKEDKNTMVASGKMVMDSIIDQLYYSKSDTSSEFDGDETKKGVYTSLSDKPSDRSLLHDLSVSRDELERKLLLHQQRGSGAGLDIARSNFVDPRNATITNHAIMKSQMLSWSGFKRKRCYSEGFKDTPEMNTLQPFDNPYYKKADSSSDIVDEDGEGDGDFQPVRKSKRRNRGQRYQELINEGIIQPSKDRQTNSKSPEDSLRGEPRIVQRESEFKEDEHLDFNPREHLRFDVLSVYPRQIRKRTQSESEKIRLEDSSRYKTGDFDLEAHIATLPACSLEKVAKPKRTTPKLRSTSESRASSVSSDSCSATEIKLTIPPHLKVKAEDIPSGPVIGSKKRKARKHSITHLMPVTAENNREESARNTSNSDEKSPKPLDCEIKDTEKFTGIKKPIENTDIQNNNGSSDANFIEIKTEESTDNEARVEQVVSKSNVLDSVCQPPDSQGKNALESHDPSPCVTTPGDRHSFPMEKDGQVQTEIGGTVSAGIVEKTSPLGISNLVKSSISVLDEIYNREPSGEESDKLSAMCESDKDRAENNSVDKDITESNSEDFESFSRGQVKEKCEDDPITDTDPCCLTSDSKMNSQGISQSTLGQPCGKQVTEVITFHLDDSRDERSKVAMQNNPLQTAVVNS